MANNCAYNIVAVGKSKKSVERLEKILSNKDEEFYLNRVFDVFVVEEASEKDGFWTIQMCGDTAWTTEPWVKMSPSEHDVRPTGAHRSNLMEICESLSIGVEVFGEDEGMGNQQHYIVNHLGEIVVQEEFHDLKLENVGDSCGLVGGVEDFGVWEDERKVF